MSGALLVMCLMRGTAHAFDVDLRVGAKGAFTLSGLTGADMPTTPTSPWLQSRLGAGGGGGLYGELHLSKLLGVELDLLFESNRLFFSGSANKVSFRQEATFEQLRVPLLAKLFLQTSDSFELTAGIGPELALGMGAGAHTDLTANGTTLADDNVLRALRYFYRADEALGVAATLELGCAFYTLRYHIPIALRFAYNVLGKSAYTDRVKLDPALNTSTLQTIESYQISLVIGFGFLIPTRDPPPAPITRGPVPDDPFAPFSGR